MTAPADHEQLAFLANVQRLLEEGQFTATYKFALLTALVDIAVERGRDDPGPLRVPLRAIAEKFAEYYWGHTRPYAGRGVLSQNKGRNIATLPLLARLQTSFPSISDARRQEAWLALITRLANLVRAMPLFRLQTLRNGGKLIFLYPEAIVDGAIELLPGVAFCLRRFAGLVRTMARTGWLAEIRRNASNAYLIEDGTNLEEFLFGSERIPLGKVRGVLLPIQSGRCFYCGEPMGAVDHVDHFVPFALYPTNLAHNLVLAHAGCNADKSDLLADLAHLERWAERNVRYGREIADTLENRGILTDLDSTNGIARWAYGRARESGALLWVRKRETRPCPPAIELPF